jgi:hypothetical protein
VKVRVAAAFLAASSLLLSLPTLALGADTAACSEYSYVNRHEGYITDVWSNMRHGMRATLENQALHQCTNPRVGEGSGAYAFVALQGPYYSDPDGLNIVQIGIGVCRAPGLNPPCPTTNHDIWAWGVDHRSPGCSGYADHLPTPVVLSSYTGGATYTVTHHDGAYHSLAGSTVHQDVGDGQICWTPSTGTAFNETQDYGDALGGTIYDRYSFFNLYFQTAQNGAWLALKPSGCNVVEGSDPNGIFFCGASGPSSSEVYAWTDR